MENYKKMAARQRKMFLALILVVAIVTLVIPEKHFFSGLLIGTIVSFYNLWLLQRRSNVLGEAAARSGKRTGLGTISRLAMVALGTLITLHYDASIAGFIIGLMLVYPIIVIDFLLLNKE
ncbi:MAG TPA: ATP synthase subunit I [Pseudogracilibacillus sp.]|nr:ATP synthase subunit I [Pseudogracilibacillus sp.]